MQYIYRGEFSKGLNSITNMGVTFEGREPAEVRDAAACNWFDGHPDYVQVVEADEAPRVPNLRPWPGAQPKKPRKKRTSAKS